MSQYLHFCLVPKEEEFDKEESNKEKELLFMAYSRNTDVYSMFNDAIYIPYRTDKEYVVLDKDKASLVIDEAKNDIKKSKQRLEDLRECYNSVDSHTTEDYNDYREEYDGLVDYIRDLENAFKEVEILISLLVHELEYSDFKEVRLFIG